MARLPLRNLLGFRTWITNAKQRNEERQELIKQIEHGFKYLLPNPELNSKIRPDVKKT
jgi:hypothetical protein